MSNVHVASSPGEGATFSMVLPRLAPAVAFDPSEPEALAR